MDYHILSQATDLKTVQVIAHIPIPIGNNAVGVPWRTAILAWQGGSVESQLPGITQGELDALKAGELYERSATMRFSILGLSDVQKLAEINAAYTAEKNRFLQEMATILNYYGFGGNV